MHDQQNVGHWLSIHTNLRTWYVLIHTYMVFFIAWSWRFSLVDSPQQHHGQQRWMSANGIEMRIRNARKMPELKSDLNHIRFFCPLCSVASSLPPLLHKVQVICNHNLLKSRITNRIITGLRLRSFRAIPSSLPLGILIPPHMVGTWVGVLRRRRELHKKNSDGSAKKWDCIK